MRNSKIAARAVTHSEASRHDLYRQTLFVVGAAGGVLLLANVYAASVATFGIVSALTSVAIYMTAGAVVISRILSFHPHNVFGWPNTVTLLRTALAALVAGYTAEISLWTLPPSGYLAWTFAVLASSAVALDGLDGWLARKVGPRSTFGARFDMESDALLILILSVLAVVLDKTGVWILTIGALRYVFFAASFTWKWLDQPLFPSRRRKTVCALQGVALSMLAMPVVTGSFAVALSLAALALILWSFAIDVLWLHRHRLTPAAVTGE